MSRWYLVFLLAGLALPAAGQSPPPKQRSAQPNSFVLTLKTGSVTLADDSQTISGNDWLFERRATSVAAIELETSLKGEAENLSFGGEILHYRNTFRPASSTGGLGGTMETTALLFRLKYYFNPGDPWQPYVGGGLGMVRTLDYGGPLHTADGLGYQGVLGMQLRTDRVGVRIEYMGLRARLTESSLNVSSHGPFVGLSFYFGRR